jgi:hypothetical protein
MRVKLWIKENIIGPHSYASYSSKDVRRRSFADEVSDFGRELLDEEVPLLAHDTFTADDRINPKFVESTVKWTLNKIVGGIGALILSFATWLGFKLEHKAESGGIAATPEIARFLERHHVNSKTADGIVEAMLPFLVFVVAFGVLQVLRSWSWVTQGRLPRPTEHQAIHSEAAPQGDRNPAKPDDPPDDVA